MESEGPYRHSRLYGRCVGGCMACIYAEGRKSMEKEFKELLDLANQAGNFNQDMMQWKIKFEDWKKARGIE